MKYLLRAADIDRAAEEIEEFLSLKGIANAQITKIRLGAEEALLRFMEQFGEAEFTLRTGSFMGKIQVSIAVRGNIFNPFAGTEDSDTENMLMRSALQSAGALPQWRYTNTVNIVTFSVRKNSVPEWLNLIIAVASAVLLWAVLKLFPENVNSFVSDQILSPILNTFMDFLRAISGPMIFLSIVWGIYSIGDAAIFSVIGKKLVLRYLIYIFLLTVIVGIGMLPLFSFTQMGSQMGSDYSSLYEMLLDIVPDNLFTPFSRGNTLQILFVGICIGLAMIFVSEKTKTVALLVEQLYCIVQVIMNVIGKLIPCFIFGSIYDMLANGEVSQLGFSKKLLFINAEACLVLAVIYVSIVCIKMKVKPITLLKKAVDTLIICLTTASSAAAFGISVETCRDRFGISEKLVNFGVPFGQVIFKPTVAVLYFSSAVCSAEYFKVAISTQWIITALIISAILSVATPPIPGGTTASFAILFTQLNVPTEALGLTLAVSIILDFINTAVDVFGGQCMLILGAKSFGLIDKEILRR